MKKKASRKHWDEDEEEAADEAIDEKADRLKAILAGSEEAEAEVKPKKVQKSREMEAKTDAKPTKSTKIESGPEAKPKKKSNKVVDYSEEEKPKKDSSEIDYDRKLKRRPGSRDKAKTIEPELTTRFSTSILQDPSGYHPKNLQYQLAVPLGCPEAGKWMLAGIVSFVSLAIPLWLIWRYLRKRGTLGRRRADVYNLLPMEEEREY